MIILEGTVTNKVINGVNGDFTVGNFQTEIGKFKIRSTLLDQYDEGEYEVRVVVKKIDLNSYMSRKAGIIITEMEIEIDQLEMLDSNVKTIDADPIEPDASVDEGANEVKADTESTPNPIVKPVKTKADKKVEPKSDLAQGEDEALAKLFGHLWPLGDEVKLDTTLPRPLFIKQKTYMSKHFELDIKTQVWTRKKGS